MATKPMYKWWETDDKTKRVYTEVLVEKLMKPNIKKTENSSDKEKSRCETAKRELLYPPRPTAPPNSPTNLESQTGSSLEKSAITPERKSKKYQFETITMETLAKYDYIKSPKKQPNTTNTKNKATNINNHSERSLIDQEWEKQLAKSNSGRMADKNQRSYYGELAESMKTPQKLLQKSNSSTQQKYNKEKSSESDAKSNNKDDGQPFSSRKPNLTQSKLAEIPEYDSSDVQETSTEEEGSTSDSATSQTGKLKNTSGVYERKEEADTKTQDKLKRTNKDNVDISILRGDELLKFLSDKYSSLCERVELLELNLFEFCDDIYKLKKAVGVKTKEDSEKATDETTINIPEQQIQLASPQHSRPYYKHALTLAANRDLLTNKYQAKSLLLKQESSPSKVGKSSMLAVQAAAKQNSVLGNDSSNKAKDEKEFTEDEIQEILRLSKSKYIDKTNYLEELGYTIREND